MRYRLQETVRLYSREHLEASGERTEIQRRHLDFYLHLAEETEARGATAGQPDRIARLEEEHDNLRAALEGSVHSSGEVALRLCGALQIFWGTRGYLAEGREWYKRALEEADSQAWTQERAKALNGAGVLANLQGDYALARTYHEESLNLFRKNGDRSGIAAALNGLGNVVSNQGDTVAARAYYEESLVLQEEIGDRHGIAHSLEAFADIAIRSGSPEQAVVLWGAAEGLREEIGSPLSPDARERYDRNVAEIRQMLGEAAFSAAWASGRAMTLNQAIACALKMP